MFWKFVFNVTSIHFLVFSLIETVIQTSFQMSIPQNTSQFSNTKITFQKFIQDVTFRAFTWAYFHLIFLLNLLKEPKLYPRLSLFTEWSNTHHTPVPLPPEFNCNLYHPLVDNHVNLSSGLSVILIIFTILHNTIARPLSAPQTTPDSHLSS